MLMEGLRKNLRAILAAFGDESVELLRRYHQEAGQVATGETLASFASEQKEDADGIRLFVTGADHVYFNEHGRGPGGFPPIDLLKRWAEVKGIFAGVEKEYQKNSIVYLIGRKIATQGSYLFRNKKTFAGFESPIGSAFTDARIQQLKKELGDEFNVFMNSEILKKYDRSIEPAGDA